MPPPKNKMDPAGAGPPPLPHMQAGSPTNTGTSSDEIAQRFAGFFFRVLATEPEKVGVLFLRVLVRAMPRSGIPTTGTTLPGLQLRRALRCQRCGATPPGRAGAWHRHAWTASAPALAIRGGAWLFVEGARRGHTSGPLMPGKCRFTCFTTSFR